MPASKKEQILEGFIAKLQKITSANGYDTNVNKVYADEIPMGLDLDEQELPAIFVIGIDDKFTHKNGWKYCEWLIELQLVHNRVDDATMHRFVRDVARVLYYDNSLGSGVPNSWRGPQPLGIHESVYLIEDLNIEEDLNLIEANRCFVYNWVIKYQTRPGDL